MKIQFLKTGFWVENAECKDRSDARYYLLMEDGLIGGPGQGLNWYILIWKSNSLSRKMESGLILIQVIIHIHEKLLLVDCL